jgi:hypothetical protein
MLNSLPLECEQGRPQNGTEIGILVAFPPKVPTRRPPSRMPLSKWPAGHLAKFLPNKSPDCFLEAQPSACTANDKFPFGTSANGDILNCASPCSGAEAIPIRLRAAADVRELPHPAMKQRFGMSVPKPEFGNQIKLLPRRTCKSLRMGIAAIMKFWRSLNSGRQRRARQREFVYPSDCE